MGADFYELGLIGYPLSHSLSPVIHKTALDAVGFAGEYRLYPISPENTETDLSALLARVRDGKIHGLNVTIPHKQTVIPLLDRLTAVAKDIGAVNTIYLQNGKLVGHNTDAQGFYAQIPILFEGRYNFFPNTAIVLGAGGSARAVCYILLKNGWNVFVAARRLEQAKALVAGLKKHKKLSKTFQAVEFTSAGLASTLRLAKFVSMVVNTTPLGMHPKGNVTPWQEPPMLDTTTTVVYDLVYNPLETKLLQDVDDWGGVGINGLGMLVEQAALAFEIWTDEPAPRELMYQAAENALTP